MDTNNIFNALLLEQENRKKPPLSKWNPEKVSDSGMRIDKEGKWYYQNSPIGRIAMVKLFASVLRLEDDIFYLVMPHEKLYIEVEDAPFLAVGLHIKNPGIQQSLLMTTNLDEHIVVDRSSPLSLADYQGSSVPYLTVREGLKARLNRNTYYHLLEHLTFEGDQGQGPLGIWSDGAFFGLES